MSLKSRLAAAEPPEDVSKFEIGADGGEFSLKSEYAIDDPDDMLRKLGVNPVKWQIPGDRIRVSSWQQSKRLENGERDVITLYSYSGPIEPRHDVIDLPALYAAARKPAKPFKPASSGRVTVVVLSDVQAGKTGSRGGTPELVDRLVEKRAALAAALALRKPERTVLAEAGDLFENFESGGNPFFTNDLSLSQQMDLAGTEVYEFLKVMHRHGHVDVLAVSSNHTAWRRGKQNLGRPSDDLGLFVHKQVQKVAVAAGLDVSWTFPAEYDESVMLEVAGTRIGMVHGNQYAPGKAIDWWARQAHGGQPVGTADILIAGHYHQLNILPSGRNPYTGKAKYFLQAPTLDNGSDWYRNLKGDDSDPGLLIFDLDENGFNLQSLTVL